MSSSAYYLPLFHLKLVEKFHVKNLHFFHKSLIAIAKVRQHFDLIQKFHWAIADVAVRLN